MIHHEDAMLTLHHGDCVEVMRELPAESVDAIVTDPPYGLEFMGKEWDRLGNGDGAVIRDPATERGGFQDGNGGNAYSRSRIEYGRRDPKAMQAWHEAWAREALRVAKPGAHLLAFGGTRTYHRLASAIEDAGWEIRDCLVWAYASGFPKSLDVSKAIDKAAGAERESAQYDRKPGMATSWDTGSGTGWSGTTAVSGVPVTPEAHQWDGWGTALKPAWEPIVLARKPLATTLPNGKVVVGTVAANVLAHGTGALNIDATRIGTGGDKGEWPITDRPVTDGVYGEFVKPALTDTSQGRWPANLLLTDPIFDGGVPGVVGGGEQQSGFMEQGTRIGHGSYGGFPGAPMAQDTYGDSGTYSRFFLIPKSSRSDREPLLRGTLAERETLIYSEKAQGPLPQQTPSRPSARENLHPTVKPVELMRHLVRLVTPPGGTVLDCFLGSGTTAIAANAEGFRCIGIEREQEYLDIAVARLAHQPLGMAL